MKNEKNEKTIDGVMLPVLAEPGPACFSIEAG
jgi:hypothetical protein